MHNNEISIILVGYIRLHWCVACVTGAGVFFGEGRNLEDARGEKWRGTFSSPLRVFPSRGL